MSRLIAGLFGALLLLMVVVGCGAGVAAAPSAPSGPVAVGAAHPLAEAEPVALQIETIDATSTLIPLGLQGDGTIEVPSLDQPMQAGWYRYGPTPGELGPAVVLGHVNARGEHGIFARLSELAPGDDVRIERADGRTAVFTVTNLDQIAKTVFPTDAVYGDTADAQLRLITCGGELDQERHSYRDNIIVYAVLSGVRSG
ncbi:MAG: class F sortase [Actinobacteria bacterium]|nr:class F sortase [Actinomycetota bacterium]